MVPAATEKKSSLFAFLNREDLAFIYMMRTLVDRLRFQGIHLPKDKLTVVDVGARAMPYGVALEFWTLQQAKKARLIAVDPEYCSAEGGSNFLPSCIAEGVSGVEQVASYIEEAVPKFKGIGVGRIDLITLFNPSPLDPLPNVTSLTELCKGTPVIGAVNCPVQYSVDHLVNGLSEQGYMITCRLNGASKNMKPKYPFDFNPLFVALPK